MTVLALDLIVGAGLFGLLALVSTRPLRYNDAILRRVVPWSWHFNPSSGQTPGIVARLKARVAQFRPLPHMRSSMLQSVLYGSTRLQPGLGRRRELLRMADGGTVSLDWVEHPDTALPCDAPVLVILGGLTSCGDAEMPLAEQALAKGFQPVLLIKRGHGVKLTTPRLQGIGDTSDFREAVAHIGRCPGRPDAQIVAMGISAGSALLASYLGEHATGNKNAAAILNNPVKAAVMISPGFDAAELFCKPFPFPYGKVLLNNLKRVILEPNIAALTPVLGVAGVAIARNCSSVKEFDAAVYAKLNGHKDLTDYWAHNNPMRQFGDPTRHNTIPCLCICSQDDRICRKELIEYDLFRNSEFGILCTTPHGGHCGWFEQVWPRRSWANGLALEYLIEAMAVKRPPIWDMS